MLRGGTTTRKRFVAEEAARRALAVAVHWVCESPQWRRLLSTAGRPLGGQKVGCAPSTTLTTTRYSAEEYGRCRVLFYSDGITESRSAEGEFFGTDRLADYLVRSTLERVSVEETVRRLSANILAFTANVLNDDATMFLVEYRVQRPAAADVE